MALPALAAAGAGCYATRPATVEPRYVARCPAGYRYDGYQCQRVAPSERVEVDVHGRY